jgi:KDO2-lipid IV(A) lauroyltransferase
MGRLVYVFSDKRRKVCNNNLKAAFGNQMSYKRRRKITKTIFKNFGLSFIELFLMPVMDDKFFGEHTWTTNFHRVDQALAKGKGMIFLSAHYGNWELAASISAHNGKKMHALAREQKPYFLNDMLNHFRQVRGTTVIQKGMQLRQILKHLKKNGIVGMIGDQSGRQGKKVDFFGRPIFIADGAFRIAAQTGSVVLPAFNVRRKHDFCHELVIEEPIEKKSREDVEEFIDRAVTRYRDLLQKYIIKHPHLWLWGNRRWKHTSARTILILNDGKTGHLRQAQAVAKSISKQTQPVTILDIDLRFKSSFSEKMVNIFVLFFGRFVRNPLFYLKMFLKKSSYIKLRDSYSDIIITTGSSTRAAGLLLAIENQSKIVSVMKPSPFSENMFDLSIIPAHDMPVDKENVLVTNGALNMVCEEYLNQMKEKMPDYVKKSKSLKIGLLIGGDSANYSLTRDVIERMIGQVKKFAVKHKADILFSTSRRTPKKIDQYLHEQLDNLENVKFKVFAKEKNFDYAIGGILAVSDVLVVTSESVSMVSEAAASGKHTITYPLKNNSRSNKTKHEFFIDNLARLKFIRKADLDSLYVELENFKKNNSKLKILDDSKALDSKIKQKII